MRHHESVWEFKWSRYDQAYICPRCGSNRTKKINGNVRCDYCTFEGRGKEIEEYEA